MVQIPSALAESAFDGIITRGDIIHFRCRFRDSEGRITDERDKFAVILNTTFPDDPVLYALATSNVEHYRRTTLHDADIVRVPVGTYTFFDRDTVISLRSIEREDLDYMRKEFGARRLRQVGRLLRVHEDHVNRIIFGSLVIERWKKKRCAPLSAQPEAS